MKGWKIYASLDEALADIEFETGLSNLVFESAERDGAERGKPIFEELDRGILNWLKLYLEHYEPKKENHSPIIGIFLELFSNAYRASIKGNGFYFISIFLGKKGVLIGTKQEYNFLTDNQISLLEKEKRVPSTRISNGCGTRTITDEGDGIFIDKLEKAIYVSKYFG